MESHTVPVLAHCCSSFTRPSSSRSLGINYQKHSDTDTQIYLSFKPRSGASQTAAIKAVECCTEKIREWMIRDKLMINDRKTEFIFIGTHQQLCKLQPCTISVGHDSITAGTQVKNLGCRLDSYLNMSRDVTS